jgi:hypothetical protein
MPSETLYTWPTTAVFSNQTDLEAHQLLAQLEAKSIEQAANTSSAPFKKILFWNEGTNNFTTIQILYSPNKINT